MSNALLSESARAPEEFSSPLAVRIRVQTRTWSQWQQEIVVLLRQEFAEVLHHVAFGDVDWTSWRQFYDDARTPSDAIKRALERDF
jgi:hypothetical protein